MSHTIRNERTKGFLSHLAKERKTRKLIRDFKMDDIMFDIEDYIPTAEEV